MTAPAPRSTHTQLRRGNPPRRLRRHPSSREEGKTRRLQLAPLDPQRFVRQVFLPVGLEIDAVGRLDLLLLPDRFLGEAREARFDFCGGRVALLRLRVFERERARPARAGVVAAPLHLSPPPPVK